MSAWHLHIDRDDYRRTTLVESEPAPLADGQVRLAVDAFGLTANNVTYAAAGDLIGYWTFFPPLPEAGDGNWGRVPVWGFADVVESRHDGVSEGERWYGYLPMSTELVVEPTRLSDHGVTDGSAHRAELPPVYNQFTRCAGDSAYDPEGEDEQMLYRPLFFTSFLIDDWLADNEFFGASTIVLTSASSKTAFGVAFLLNGRPDVTVVGLTSPGNVDFVESLHCYDQVLAYDDAGSLPDGAAVLVEFSGNPAVVRSVHERYGDDLRFSSAVGITHWQDFGGAGGPLPGPAPEMFFAPAQIERRRADWGPGVVEHRLAEAWQPFVESVAGWVTVEHLTGPDAVRDTWVNLVSGTASPGTAQVLHTGD